MISPCDLEGEKAMKKRFLKFEWIFGAAAVLLLGICGIYFGSGVHVTVCACLGILGSVLNGKGRKECYFLLLLSSLMYATTALSSKLYGEAILHFALVSPLFLYSILRWYRPHSREQKKDVFALKPKTILLLGALMLVLAVGYGFLLRRMGSNLPFLNAASTMAALAANYLSARRMKEQWYAQLVSNAVLITVWCLTSLGDPAGMPFMLQNILFVISNLRGAVLWNQMSKEAAETSHV